MLVGRDTSRPVGEQVVVLAPRPRRQLAGARRAAARRCCCPPKGSSRPRRSPTTRALGAIAVAAFDEGGAHRPLLRPRRAARSPTAIVHFDGSEWTREPVEVPAGSETELPRSWRSTPTGLGNAWALAEADDALGRSVVLLERTSTAGRAALGGAAAGRHRRSPTRDNAGRRDRRRGADRRRRAAADRHRRRRLDRPDGDDRRRRARRHALLRQRLRRSDRLAGATRPSAAAPLGVKLSRQGGYRSFAWAGGGFGTRVITNPLDPGGGEDSNRGTYLRFADGAFVRMPGGGGNFRAQRRLRDRRQRLARGPGRDLRQDGAERACSPGRSRCGRRSPT